MDVYVQTPSTGGIYRITCIPTGKFYIGSAINLRRRWSQHRHDLFHNKRRNPKLQDAWNKYGPNAFVFEVLELILIPEMLIVREQYWFDTTKPFGKRGFNLSTIAKSRLGMKATPEQIEKNRIAHLGQTAWNKGKKHTPETIDKCKRAHIGQPSSMLGRKHTLETRAKMRFAHLGKPSLNRGKSYSPEAKKRMSDAQRGRVHSQETRNKISHANQGRKPSEKNRAKLMEHNKARMVTLIAISPDGIEYVVHGINTFCREHHLNPSNLRQVAQNKRTQTKGWTARYP